MLSLRRKEKSMNDKRCLFCKCSLSKKANKRVNVEVWKDGYYRGSGLSNIGGGYVCDVCYEKIKTNRPLVKPNYSTAIPNKGTITCGNFTFEDVDIKLELLFDKLYSDGIPIPPDERCTRCSGKGIVPKTGFEACPRCNGTGSKYKPLGSFRGKQIHKMRKDELLTVVEYLLGCIPEHYLPPTYYKEDK